MTPEQALTEAGKIWPVHPFVQIYRDPFTKSKTYMVGTWEETIGQSNVSFEEAFINAHSKVVAL